MKEKRVREGGGAREKEWKEGERKEKQEEEG